MTADFVTLAGLATALSVIIAAVSAHVSATMRLRHVEQRITKMEERQDGHEARMSMVRDEVRSVASKVDLVAQTVTMHGEILREVKDGLRRLEKLHIHWAKFAGALKPDETINGLDG